MKIVKAINRDTITSTGSTITQKNHRVDGKQGKTIFTHTDIAMTAERKDLLTVKTATEEAADQSLIHIIIVINHPRAIKRNETHLSVKCCEIPKLIN